MKSNTLLNVLQKLRYPIAFVAGFVCCAAVPDLKDLLEPAKRLENLLAIIYPIALLKITFVPVLRDIRRFSERSYLSCAPPLLKGTLAILLFNVIVHNSFLGKMTGYGALAIAGGVTILLFNLEAVIDRLTAIFVKPNRSDTVASSVRNHSLLAIPEPCSGCKFYCDHPDLSCAVNPSGPINGICRDFAERILDNY